MNSSNEIEVEVPKSKTRYIGTLGILIPQNVSY